MTQPNNPGPAISRPVLMLGNTNCKNSEVRYLAKYILNRYDNTQNSITRYEKMKEMTFEWQHGGKSVKRVISFKNLVNRLKTKKQWSLDQSEFPPLLGGIVDASMNIGLPQTIVGSDGNTVVFKLPTQMGDSFPITPTLDRAGIVASDMESLIEKSIIRLFYNLVETSERIFQIESGWLSEFRMLVHDCISAIDIFLHKIYLLAEYRGGELGWRFDRERLGRRHGIRLGEKFEWICQISGHPLDNANEERRRFEVLRELRNHFAHFDPPCFAASVEDIVRWLNCVSFIGKLIWRIREKFQMQLNDTIVQLILLPEVTYDPVAVFGRDIPENPDTGYCTSIWSV